MGCCKSSSKREVYSDIGFPQETRKSQISNRTYHVKELEKEEQRNPKSAKERKL